jgi:nucleoside phosphorylase
VRQSLIGSTGHHARVVLFTITEKEFPVASDLLEQLAPIAEVGTTGAHRFSNCLDTEELPFVLVQQFGARANLAAASSVNKLIRDFRPQYFLVIGTAGGVHRPAGDDEEPYTWEGPRRGDVVYSEYLHYGSFMKVSRSEYLMRHQPLDQPSTVLFNQARGVMRDGSWTDLSKKFRRPADPVPRAKNVEILSGETVQDNPLEPVQQFLMKHFDRAGAIEMESGGVAERLYSTRETVHYAPGFLTVRGISDIVYARGRRRRLRKSDIPESTKGKTEERDEWSPIAAAAATAFAVALTERLVKVPQSKQTGHRKIEGYAIPKLPDVSDPQASLKS